MVRSIDLQQTNISSIMRDYLNRKPVLEDCFSRFPSEENYLLQGKIKLKEYKHRALIHRVLSRQMQGLDLSEKQKENLNKIEQDNTLSITTGHQLNLATGPLYFIYKIMQVVKACDSLNKNQSEMNFVPIYWMATEDHDFDEINHFSTYKETYTWESAHGGAVGRMPTKGMNKVLEPFFEQLPKNKNAEKLKQILTKSYLNNHNLSYATRLLVQELLGDFGILILDADDSELKKEMIPIFREELLHSPSQKEVAKANEKLKDYGGQAYAREINLFYLSPNKRERIEREGNIYRLVESGETFSQEEIMQDLERNPEAFSPNVILRPLYQEVVLPNVAYVGGGGEIAYWLQLKGIFDYFKVSFPLLVLRNSMLILPKYIEHKAAKLGLISEKLFEPKDKIVNQWLAEQTTLFKELDQVKESLESNFGQIQRIAEQTHVTFSEMLRAQEKKQLKGWGKLQKRLYKAERKRLDKQVAKIEEVYQYAFPGGTWQERKINFSNFYIEEGASFLAQVYREIQAFDAKFIIKNSNTTPQK